MTGRSAADAASGLRPFGAEPQDASQAKPLVPNADDAADEAARLGDLYREVQARNYGCSGDIECTFLLDGNCYCFNHALELHVAERVGEVLYPTPTAIAFALPLVGDPGDDDWRLGDEACEMLACVNTDGETAAAQLAHDYRNVAQFLRASAIEARRTQSGSVHESAGPQDDAPTPTVSQ